jgi:hypothetical protein
MSKPDYPHFDTQTLELRHCIDTAIAAISPDHWVLPATRELFADPPIIQVSENEAKSDDDEVIPSSYCDGSYGSSPDLRTAVTRTLYQA